MNSLVWLPLESSQKVPMFVYQEHAAQNAVCLCSMLLYQVLAFLSLNSKNISDGEMSGPKLNIHMYIAFVY